MKEFDKIYIAKYSEIIGTWQTGRDLGVKTQEVEDILENLKTIGLYDVYKNMSNYEWDELEKKSDIEILNIYLTKVPGYFIKIFNEIVEEFREEIPNYKYLFEMYKPEEYKYNFDYFREEDFDGEEWKQIGKLNYEVI